MPGPVGSPDEVLVHVIALKAAIDGLEFRVSMIAIGLVFALASLILMISAGINQIIEAIREQSAAVQKTIDGQSDIATFGDR